MSKHTAGQWFYGATECHDNESALAICKQNIDAHTKASSGYFYEVFLDDGRRIALVGHGPDGEANARLIAAAPDLLQCLKWMVALHEAKPGISNGAEYCAALNAIAKAKGGPA